MPRILVADDNTNIQKMVVLAFQERGVEVIAVGNGEAAVRRLPDANPDLVLADVFMPVRNGYEVCEFVKKDPRFAHVPVILLVGAFDPLDEKEARRVGADGVLKKPFVPPDPLIAMVMSALEKNPKVAAELAKAKEVAAEALLPPALPEVPLKAEPKPLPEFPEPTAEEAALIYGFGKGVRAIDLEDTEEDERESSKSKKLAKPVKDAKAPKAPAAPKTPVVAAIDDDEDDFDSSVTANDWRRNAADFEVPENVAADPVYSYGKGFEPITFPSEKDVPPRRRKTDERGAEETAASADSKIEARVDAATTAPGAHSPAAEISPAPAQASVDRAPAKKANEWDAKDQPEIELAAGSFSRLEEPDSQARFTTSEALGSSAVAPSEAVEPAAAPSVAQQLPAALEPPPSRPTLVSRMRGWMDMLTPSSPDNSSSSEAEPAESRDDHWMSKLSSPTAVSPAASSPAASASTAESQSAPAAESAAVPAEAAASAPPVVNPAAETQPIDATLFVSTATEPASRAATEFFAPSASSEAGEAVRQETRGEVSAEPNLATHVQARSELQDEVRVAVNPSDQPRQFGAGGERFGGSSYHFSDDPHHGSQREVHDDGLELDRAPAQEVASDYSSGATVSEGLNGEAEPQPEPVTSGAADFSSVDSAQISPEVLPSAADVPVNGRGALSGMLPAEPLFGSESREEIADDYSPRDEEPAETDARAQEALAEETHPGQLPQAEASEEYWDREAAAHETEILAKSGASLFSESAPEPPAMQGFERIPTLPPPNREALSEIPFLMPPVLPPQNSEQPAARSNDSEAVDDMVRKVMEKLGPHLQELLSQGVKPLVENLLQNELQKKER